MLTLKLEDSRSYYNEATEEFCYTKPITLKLEHSLLAISKWETKFCKPYLVKESRTDEEIEYYVWCMILSPEDVPIDYVRVLNHNERRMVADYLKEKATATIMCKRNKKGKASTSAGEDTTSELIYYWMSALQIPFIPCETWNINRLIKLIEVANAHQEPPEKMSQKSVIAQQRAINEARKKKYGTKG